MPPARSFVVDVSDESRVQALIEDVVAAEGGLDTVFANAGIALVPGFAVEGGQTLDTVESSVWHSVLGVNLDGVLFTMKHAAAIMKRQGSGRIVVTSSNAGLRAEPEVCYGYAASKAAIVNLVRQAALELAPHGVHVNAICPGPFKGTRIGGGVTENPTAELEHMWAAHRAARTDGRPGGAQRARAAARLPRLELHDRRRLPRRRRHARAVRLILTGLPTHQAGGARVADYDPRAGPALGSAR